MANKGETKCLKSYRALATSGVEKTRRFLFKPNPGKHNGKEVISVGYLLRDLLHLADNSREIKYIINNREIIVDKKKVKSYRLPLGLFDIIEIPKINKYYNLVYVRNGALMPKEISKDETKYKICKIISKKIIKKKNVQLITNDGRSVITSNLGYKVKSSIKLDLEDNTIKEYYPLEKGKDVLVIGGKHISHIAKISDITKGTMQKPMLIKLETEGIKFETTENNVIVIN